MAVFFTSKLKDCFVLPNVSAVTVAAVMAPLLDEAYGKTTGAQQKEMLLAPPPRHWGAFRYDDVLQELSWDIRDKLVADSYADTMKQVVDVLESLCERNTLRPTWSAESRVPGAFSPAVLRGVMGRERALGVPASTPAMKLEERSAVGKFQVRWEGKFAASAPAAAARQALAQIRNDAERSHVFEVVDGTGAVTTVDLDVEEVETMGMRA